MASREDGTGMIVIRLVNEAVLGKKIETGDIIEAQVSAFAINGEILETEKDYEKSVQKSQNGEKYLINDGTLIPLNLIVDNNANLLEEIKAQKEHFKDNLLTYKGTIKYANDFLLNDQKWLIDNQYKDGGWHEVDRVRSRIGTTADAIRGIILDDSYIKNVENGIKFLIDNQNIYHGYWMAGNVDKMSDALKGLLNSVNLLKDINLKDDCIECIKKRIKWLYNNYEEMENLEENEYDLLTITIDFENIILDSKKPSFI